MRRSSFLFGPCLVLAFGCGVGPEYGALAATNDSSLGENGDTDLIRVPVGTSIDVTADCREHDYPRGSSLAGTPTVTSDDTTVLLVEPMGGDVFRLHGQEVGDTLLRFMGGCEETYPLRVVPTP